MGKCEVCGEACPLVDHWYMGGAPGEYEAAMAKHWGLGYERSQAALAAANARADEWQALAKTNAASLAVITEALAAARRECEGLQKLLSDARPWVHQLYRMQDCHSETAPEATKILRTLKRIDAALAAPADGEEGT